jgi:TM2 domain-containing membrane protein YozV
MRVLIITAIITGLLFCLAPAQAEEESLILEPKVAKYSYSAIPKDPLASALFSATFPGMGQLYNKEYTRGIITGVGYWASFFTVSYLLFVRLEEINKDTFYIEDTDGAFHQVTTPKEDDESFGLPRTEQALLIGSAASTMGFYIWGIIDSYKGAKRYNKKLISGANRKFNLRLASSLPKRSLQLKATYKF